MSKKPESVLAWHFLPDDGKTRDFDGQRKRRKIKAGTVMAWPKPKPLKMCDSGLHASENILDALGYAPGSICCRVECSGEMLKQDDKLVCRRRKVLWMVDATETLHLFACWCAERALRRERKAGREPDKRSWEAIRVKRRWLKGKATDEELSTARATAARDAAANAARDAARDAAWGAAWDTARDAARDAAANAAWAAANAEREAQEKKLVAMVESARKEVSS